MRAIRFNRRFTKHYKKRILSNHRLSFIFDERYKLFVAGERGYPLYDHMLTGNLTGKRSFSITADIRVIYEETEEAVIFLDVGTHAQVYE